MEGYVEFTNAIVDEVDLKVGHETIKVNGGHQVSHR